MLLVDRIFDQLALQGQIDIAELLLHQVRFEELVSLQHFGQCDSWIIHTERGLEKFESGHVAEGDSVLIVLNLDDGDVEPVEDGVDTLLEFQTAAQDLFRNLHQLGDKMKEHDHSRCAK